MADNIEVVTPSPEPVVTAPVVTPVETPVVAVETPVAPEVPPVAPVVTTEVAPVVTPETPVVEPVKAPETVLGEALTETPAEVPKEGEPAEPNEGGQSDEPAPPPKYDSFTLPEGITLDESRVGDFTNLLAELETSGKASHEAVQAFGQKAVEFHINEVKTAVESVTKYYEQAWDKQKTDWKESFLKDPEIGGNRFQTTVDSALTFIRTHGGTAEQQNEFRAVMESTGLGNHPAMIRLLANAGRAMSEGKPLAAPKPVPNAKSKTQTMYGQK